MKWTLRWKYFLICVVRVLGLCVVEVVDQLTVYSYVFCTSYMLYGIYFDREEIES